MLGFFYVGMSEWSKVDGCNPECREFESHSQLNKPLWCNGSTVVLHAIRNGSIPFRGTNAPVVEWYTQRL